MMTDIRHHFARYDGNKKDWSRKMHKNLSIFDNIKSGMRQNIPELVAKGKGKSKQKHRGIFDVWSFK